MTRSELKARYRYIRAACNMVNARVVHGSAYMDAVYQAIKRGTSTPTIIPLRYHMSSCRHLRPGGAGRVFYLIHEAEQDTEAFDAALVWATAYCHNHAAAAQITVVLWNGKHGRMLAERFNRYTQV